MNLEADVAPICQYMSAAATCKDCEICVQKTDVPMVFTGGRREVRHIVNDVYVGCRGVGK